MKTFTKIAFLLIFILPAYKSFAQCTPNTAMAKGSILPQAIKYGYQNVAYNEVIYFRAPEDTSAKTPLGTFPAHIDSMEITGVNGLPPSFNYNCFDNNCKINGGESSCISLSGTATQTGVYPLTVYITTYATLKTAFGDVPTSQKDSNTNYTLYVFGSVGLAESNLKNQVAVYPNPVNDILNISNTSADLVNAILVDITGKPVLEKEFSGNGFFNTTSLSKGIYLLHLSDKKTTIVKKIVVE